MSSDKEIIQKCYHGKIDKKKLVKLGGTVAFVDILQDAITEARKDQDQKTHQEEIERAVSILFDTFIYDCKDCYPATHDDTAVLCGKHEEILLSFERELKKEA